MSATRNVDAGISETSRARATRTRRRQVHIWLSEREHEWLRLVAGDNDQSVSEFIRTLVVKHRQASRAATRVVDA